MYLLFLDESGYYNESKPCDYPESDFFVLGGVIIKEQNYHSCTDQFADFKTRAFPKGVESIPIHARDLNQIGKSNKNCYNGFLTPENGQSLLVESYKYISTLSIEAIAVIVDNISMRKQYATPANPYEWAYEIMLEKFDNIIRARKEQENCLGVINISKSNARLAINLTRAHDRTIKHGVGYTIPKTILPILNIQPTPTNCFFEIADMVCYAHQRAYRNWLCKNLSLPKKEEDYLSLIYDISKNITIGSHRYQLDGDRQVKVKVLPYPRKFDGLQKES